jgi:hypothetical protein
MAKAPQSQRRDDEPEIADAAALFGDEAQDRSGSPGPVRPATTGNDDVFDVVGGHPAADDKVVPVAPVPRRSARPTKRSVDVEADEPRAGRQPDESATVDQVWSRGAEWGPTLILLGVVALAFAFLFFLVVSSAEGVGLPFLVLMIGAAVLVVLSYPIVITLERPVRITPEQAIKDYYAALSHHLPHYRRMWLLLSSTGRISSSFGSFEGFKGYWKARLAELRAGRAQGMTPLVFEVQDYKAEKSGGKQFVDARYKVAVYVRGRHAEGPFATIKVQSGLVKGPDNMWYLNNGTLPDSSS